MEEKTPVIEPVAKERIDDALACLSLAFAGDPTVRWMFPEARQYLEVFPRFATAYGGVAFEEDTAFRIGDGGGISLWAPPGAHADDEAVQSVLSEAIDPARHDEVFATFGELDEYHPKEPHWYLAIIGVDPGQQGGGLGGQLLAHTLAKCDEDGLPAYLESSNPANVSLYRRHGFEPTGTIIIGGEPLMTPMLRPAQGRS